MTPPQQFRAKLADKVILNQKFIQLFFELVAPTSLTFEAGQYVSIAIPGQGGARRSYSICSEPSKGHGFELMIDIEPNGIGVRYLHSLKFGDEIECLAPLGMFVIPEQTPEPPLIYVATGSGIAPFRSMILDQLQTKKNTQPMTLYWGLRFAEQLFWEDDFEELAEDFPNFAFHPVLSRPVPEWPLCQGRVTDCLSVHDLREDAQYYLCGSDKMIADVKAVLEKRNVSAQQIHHEKFY